MRSTVSSEDILNDNDNSNICLDETRACLFALRETHYFGIYISRS